MKNNDVIKPTILQMTSGLFISLIESMFSKDQSSAPETVGNYTLIVPIKNKFEFENYTKGIYQIGRKKVFIKTWRGKIKNYDYYALINEYSCNRILHNKLDTKLNQYEIKIPKVSNLLKTSDSLSLVYEFINGKKLSTFATSFQAEVISKLISTLSNTTTVLSKYEKTQFTARRSLFYISSLFVFTILSISSSFKNYKSIMKSFIKCILSIKFLKSKTLYLTHRDLFPKNILISKSAIYILDCEYMVLTMPDYDLTHLSLNSAIDKLSKMVNFRLNRKPNSFLKNYILIHHSIKFNDPPNFNNFYLEKLNALYSK